MTVTEVTDYTVDWHMGDPVSLSAMLIAGKKVAPDATLLLEQDHREAMAMFDACDEQTDPAEKAALVRRLCRALLRHMEIEEEIFYPAAAAATGRDDLTEHGRKEHGEAREIMLRIDNALGRGEPPDQDVHALRHAIEHHVEDEEDEMFPTVRKSGLDLAAVGRRLAARKVALLYRRSDGRVQDSGYDPLEKAMSETRDHARDLLIKGLRDIHAAIRQGEAMLQAQLPRLKRYPQMAERLQAHQQDKTAQLKRVEAILDGLGHDRSSMKDMMMATAGDLATRMNATKDDEILKNSLAMFGMANFEIASYESLVILATAADQAEAAKLLQTSLSEERAMAAWLAENLRGVLLAHLEFRATGREDTG